MNLSTMRTILRRRLHDNPDDHSARTWSDSDLLVLLNLGYQREQQTILQMSPEAWLKTVLMDTQNDSNGRPQKKYPKPPDMWWEVELAVKDSTAADVTDGYRPLERDDYDLIAHRNATNNVDGYAEFGQFFFINPPPLGGIVDGLRLTYVNILSLTDDDGLGAMVPAIPVPLHDAIVVWAERIAKGETDEDSIKLKTEVDAINEILPNFYQRHGQKPDALALDIDNGQGIRRGFRARSNSRGTWSRYGSGWWR